MRFRTSHLIVAAAAVLGFSSPQAQTYPSQPIRVIVPSAAGGTPDILVRTVTAEATRRLGQPFIIDNKAGASGIIGMTAIEQSPPDGYIIGYGNNATLATNRALLKKIPYKPEAMLPVILLGKVPNIIAANPGVQIGTLAELLARAKGNPGKFTFATAGNGTSGHLSGELLAQSASASLTHVPYKGSPAALTDVVGGRVDLMIDNIPSISPFVKDGRLKAIAITGAKRSPLFPDVPTVAETVLPGFESVGWGGFVAPAGTPKAVIARLNAVFNEVLSEPGMKDKLLSMGIEAAGGTPEALSKYTESETRKWAPIIEHANIQLN